MLGLAAAQSPASVWDGVYSEAQAGRGAALYQTACASCHGDKLQGKGQTPALTGSDFVMNWSGMTVGDLFDKIQTSMPADKPGSLSREQNASLVAYLLSANKFPVRQGRTFKRPGTPATDPLRGSSREIAQGNAREGRGYYLSKWPRNLTPAWNPWSAGTQ